MKLPAVMSVRGAMSLEPGQTVTIDGSQGLVQLVNDK
jgi:hypothetical protein